MARSRHYCKYHNFTERSMIRDVNTFAARFYSDKRHLIKMALQTIDIDSEEEIIEKVETIIYDIRRNPSHYFWFD